MKLNQIIKKYAGIEIGKASLFIAEKDIDFFNLPILKGSLVYFDGEKNLSINAVRLAVLRNAHNRGWLLEELPQNEDGGYLVEKASSCDNEMDYSEGMDDLGIWHKDHFDYLPLDPSEYYLNRIENAPKLMFNNCEFSSIQYTFNVQRRTLVHFISTKKIELEVGGHLIHLPENLEIGYANNTYTVISLNDIVVYKEFKLGKFLTVLENGIVLGVLAEDVDYMLRKDYKLTLRKDVYPIEIYPDGSGIVEIWDDKTNMKEKITLRKKVNGLWL